MQKKNVNVVIQKQGKTLANCYFAVEDTYAFNEELSGKLEVEAFTGVREAVIFFQKVGAGFEKAEMRFAREMPELKGLNLKKCEDRELGSIGVSEDAMSDNERWGEYEIKFEI